MALLFRAVEQFLSKLGEVPKPEILWHMQYSQRVSSQRPTDTDSRIITLPEISSSPSLGDDVLDNVRAVWEKIVGQDYAEGFMKFEDREKDEAEEGE